jgi:Ca2+-binding RTX toxin-like protein
MARKAIAAAALAALAVVAAAPAASPRAAVSCFGERPTIVAGRFETRGTEGDDVIVDRTGGGLIESKGGDDLICLGGGTKEVYAGAGADRIAGGAGSDYLDPGAGRDRVGGGRGNDHVYDLDNADDVLSGGAGVDQIAFSRPYHRLTPPVRASLRSGRATGHGRDRLESFEDIEGTGRPDVLVGNGRDNFIDAVRGGDRVVAAGGDDTILGASLLVTEIGVADRYDGADPLLQGGSGDDQIFAGAGTDVLSGGPGDDRLDGGGP